MNDNRRQITRKELYNRVWAEPMSKLAREYGLSDVGLAKICKKHNIPRPPKGYWARKAAGYKVKQLPLPPGDEVTIEIRPNPRTQRASKYKKVVSKMAPSEKSEETPIVVPDRLSNPHLLIRRSSDVLNAQQPNDVGVVNPPNKECLDIAVSKNSLRRALRIMDTVIKALENLGYSVYLFEGHTKTKIKEVAINFGLSEKLTTKKRRTEEHDLKGPYRFGHSRFLEERAPSGDLSLTIHDAEDFYIYGCQQNWNDGTKSKLENRINSFIDGLVTVAAAKIEADKERQEKERLRIERQKHLEEERLKRAELRRRYLEEQERVTILISQAENWKRSQVLLEYIAEIERGAASNELAFPLEKPLVEWLKWARDQAARLDPLSPSPTSILDQECPEEESIQDPYYRW